ncbi:hypothetical protein BpHYR1_010029 [Brachionus plicatilis]|uniref:Uncharacterized protein n=1 Tax=Brachionus plicatilis TaxID=10195 RepID=A0A3M7QEW7_BRAPC|nr:hypothetical protein BpHYR1_010029 [Brachionus plicatilis]
MSYEFVFTAKRVTLKSKSNLIFDTCDIEKLELRSFEPIQYKSPFWSKSLSYSNRQTRQKREAISLIIVPLFDHHFSNVLFQVTDVGQWFHFEDSARVVQTIGVGGLAFFQTKAKPLAERAALYYLSQLL